MEDRASNDRRIEVRAAAIKELGRLSSEEPDRLVALIKRVATQDSSSLVREVAIEALARRWKADLGVQRIVEENSLVSARQYRVNAGFSARHAGVS